MWWVTGDRNLGFVNQACADLGLGNCQVTWGKACVALHGPHCFDKFAVRTQCSCDACLATPCSAGDHPHLFTLQRIWIPRTTPPFLFEAVSYVSSIAVNKKKPCRLLAPNYVGHEDGILLAWRRHPYQDRGFPHLPADLALLSTIFRWYAIDLGGWRMWVMGESVEQPTSRLLLPKLSTLFRARISKLSLSVFVSLSIDPAGWVACLEPENNWRLLMSLPVCLARSS